MKIKKIFSVILCAVLTVMVIPFSASSQTAEIEPEYVEDEVVFEYTKPASMAKARSIKTPTESNLTDSLSYLGIESIEEVELYDDSMSTMSSNSEYSEPVTYVAKISGDVMETCEELEKVNGVSFAEPNYIYRTASFSMPTEVSLTQGVYVNNIKWYFDFMQIPEAWEKYETSGENVVVAIIDNGFNINGVDAPTNLWTDENGNHGWNTYKNSNDISPIYRADGVTPLPDTSHGSNVMGIVGMSANNYNGIGAAYGAQLMLINAAHYVNDTSNTLFSSTNIASAINYARTNGADIINLSLGAYSYSVIIKNAVNNAYNAGISLFAAAGNGQAVGNDIDPVSASESPFYPAAASNVIGVMASDKTDTSQLAYFSNYDPTGTMYDVTAPGVDIIGCEYNNTTLSYSSGTSQACPIVAACAAMYLSVYPDTTVDELYDAVRNSPTAVVSQNTTKLPDENYTFKVLNALELLDYGSAAPTPIINVNTAETSATADNNRGYFYGLDENYSDISNYITVEDGTGTLEFVPTSYGNGTGSLIRILDNNNEVYKEYIVIIFGDVNGDCHSDGCDAVLTSCILAQMTGFTDFQEFAADVNFGNSVDEEDVSIITQYAVGLDNVFQTR